MKTREEKKKFISAKFIEIMTVLGMDLEDDSLAGTPDRLAKLYVDEIFSGMGPETFPKLTAVENKFHLSDMVTVKDITVNSTCEHHFLPFFGSAKIAYIPKDKILGLSKFNRLVDYYARRPQIQERLTNDIRERLVEELETEDVAVLIEAAHTCVMTRGIKDRTSKTVTVAIGGVFKKPEVRSEFLSV